MKRSYRLLAVGVVAAMLGACATSSTVPGQTPEQVAQSKVLAFATTVNKQCGVALPFLSSMVMLQTDPAALKTMQTISDDAAKICSVAATIVAPPIGSTTTFDFASVQAFVNSEIPTLLGIVKASKLNDNQKLAAELGITGAQLAISTALANAQ